MGRERVEGRGWRQAEGGREKRLSEEQEREDDKR